MHMAQYVPAPHVQWDALRLVHVKNIWREVVPIFGRPRFITGRFTVVSSHASTIVGALDRSGRVSNPPHRLPSPSPPPPPPPRGNAETLVGI